MMHGNKTEASFSANGTDDAALIHPLERDIELMLHSKQWGNKLEGRWQSQSRPHRHFERQVEIQAGGRESSLTEHIVRFPSAPIYGINRKRDYEVDLTAERPNLHTLRVLTRPTLGSEPVDRVFLLHNGLDETQNLRFFYQLTDWILKEDEDRSGSRRSACVIVPFPGHLMHFPFAGRFVQSPLSRYLSDSGELFRHFIRYMVEMHWLLSILNPDSPEEWMVGGAPCEGNTDEVLHRDWTALRKASLVALEEEEKEAEKGETATIEQRVAGGWLESGEVSEMISVLRSVLGLQKKDTSVPIHVVGYSLGGFMAQSVFLAWPNMVTSCATICSGGAISSLSPTAFAHAEEWQAVLHSLRAEIEGSMLAGQISHEGEERRIAGMAPGQFGYFHRIFNQVFLQEDPASYKQRLSEYGSRMLFISGGEDPIVKTRDVLDASPPEGITMLSIARMTHFLGEEARSEREEDQRRFWLPEAGGLIARAAGRAEELKHDERERATTLREEAVTKKRKLTPERPTKRELGSEEFERALDWVVDGLKSEDGWLFVCRNGVPGALLPEKHRLSLGTALHHHDLAVQDYVAGLSGRAKALWAIRRQTTLVLSHKLRDNFVGDRELFEPHSDAPGKLSTIGERTEAFDEFICKWRSRVRWFEAKHLKTDWPAKSVQGLFAERAARWQEVPVEHLRVARIPDVWISVRHLEIGLDRDDPDGTARNFIRWVSNVLAEQQSPEARHGSQRKSKKLASDLKDGRVRIVKVSGADLNPRYRGRLETGFNPALQQLAHCAAALVRSVATSTNPQGSVST